MTLPIIRNGEGASEEGVATVLVALLPALPVPVDPTLCCAFAVAIPCSSPSSREPATSQNRVAPHGFNSGTASRSTFSPSLPRRPSPSSYKEQAASPLPRSTRLTYSRVSEATTR